LCPTIELLRCSTPQGLKVLVVAPENAQHQRHPERKLVHALIVEQAAGAGQTTLLGL
jgi:hypothetical protein